MTHTDKDEFFEFIATKGVESKDQPYLEPYLLIYYKAFLLLSSRRVISFSAQAISLSEIVSYLTLYPTDDHDLFINLILQLDYKFLELKKDDSV